MHKILIAMAALAVSAAGADFFPLQTGNTWKYRNAETGAEFTVQVGLPVFMNNYVYYSIRGYADDRLLARVNVRSELVALNEETGIEQVVTSFAGFGGWWDAPVRGCDQQGQTLDRREIHDGPTGPIGDVLPINFRILTCADIGVVSEQYAENIGMVRRVTTSIAGPRRFDLVYARVGKIAIDAAQHATFSVSVNPPSASSVDIVWRLETNSPDPVKLRFSTGQEYDVRVRDENGNEIWRWSAGKFFTAAFHVQEIGVGWSTTVSIPRDRFPVPGKYTVEAWLTTASPNPQFATTVPIIIPE
jgi:hypothetical protein